MSRPLSFLLMALAGVVLVALVYVAEWIAWRRMRLDGLADPRVLAPIAERVTQNREALSCQP